MVRVSFTKRQYFHFMSCGKHVSFFMWEDIWGNSCHMKLSKCYGNEIPLQKAETSIASNGLQWGVSIPLLWCSSFMLSQHLIISYVCRNVNIFTRYLIAGPKSKSHFVIYSFIMSFPAAKTVPASPEQPAHKRQLAGFVCVWSPKVLANRVAGIWMSLDSVRIILNMTWWALEKGKSVLEMWLFWNIQFERCLKSMRLYCLHGVVFLAVTHDMFNRFQ